MGCQFKPEVLFENINVGDNLEVCLAKGSVQHNTNDENIFELRNNNIANTYFTNNEVKFDEKSTVKEINLKFHEGKNGKTAKEVFNFMTQYFCQRYEGMKTEKIDEIWEKFGFSWQKKGMQNIWETNKIKFTLSFYTNDPIYKESELNPNKPNFISSMAREAYGGQWVQLKIIAK